MCLKEHPPKCDRFEIFQQEKHGFTNNHHCVDCFSLWIDQILIAKSVSEYQIDVEDQPNEHNTKNCNHQMEVKHVAEDTETTELYLILIFKFVN